MFPVSEISKNSPPSYENWQCYRGGNLCSSACEVNLYTDAGHITGETEVGPYKFLNPLLNKRGDDNIRPAVILRWFSHWPSPRGIARYEETSDNHYHGGDQFDEIAAILSLLTGLRFAAGGINREFYYDSAEMGRPVGIPTKHEPVFIPPLRQLQIARFRSDWNITDAWKIRVVFEKDREMATAIVKVARLYQQAMWIADGQPETAWLLLISAVETAADFWSKQNPTLVFKDEQLDPKIDKMIRETASENIREPLTEFWQEKNKAIAKFVEFLMTFLPAPPASRPEAGRIDFSNAKELRKDFKILYSYRSRALHSGKAFPAPLCQPPSIGMNEEKPIALGMSTGGAQWWFEDTPMPMLLHTFEHIARGALLKWTEVPDIQPVSDPREISRY